MTSRKIKQKIEIKTSQNSAMLERPKELIAKAKECCGNKRAPWIVIIVIIVIVALILIIKLVPSSNNAQTDDTVTISSLMWMRNPVSNPGSPFDQKVTWQEAKDTCENLDFAGHKDWRLPSVQELFLIVDYSKTSPSIDRDIFPNARALPYWTSTEYSGNETPVWAIHFSTGLVFDTSKQDKAHVRCVRGK